jgi:hypothetical protein
MSLIGFSPRGRGQSKSITTSPLPLSTGKIHVSSLAFKGTSVVLPPLPPLPPLPNGLHITLVEQPAITRVPQNQPLQSPIRSSAPSEEPISTTPQASVSSLFEGKIPSTGSHPTSPVHSIHRIQRNNSPSNLSHQGAHNAPLPPISHQGTRLRSLLSFWLLNLLDIYVKCYFRSASGFL